MPDPNVMNYEKLAHELNSAHPTTSRNQASPARQTLSRVQNRRRRSRGALGSLLIGNTTASCVIGRVESGRPVHYHLSDARCWLGWLVHSVILWEAKSRRWGFTWVMTGEIERLGAQLLSKYQERRIPSQLTRAIKLEPPISSNAKMPQLAHKSLDATDVLTSLNAIDDLVVRTENLSIRCQSPAELPRSALRRRSQMLYMKLCRSRRVLPAS